MQITQRTHVASKGYSGTRIPTPQLSDYYFFFLIYDTVNCEVLYCYEIGMIINYFYFYFTCFHFL